jgi:hypothetical protein
MRQKTLSENAQENAGLSRCSLSQPLCILPFFILCILSSLLAPSFLFFLPHLSYALPRTAASSAMRM